MIHVKGRRATASRALVEAAASKTLAIMHAAGDLTVVLADDGRLRSLNKAFLHIDAPTDVLSFPSADTDPETGHSYLGDVIISLPRARSQAAQAGHAFEAELQLLVVHGVLHLLGHDHAEPNGKKRMWAVQIRALKELGIGRITIQE